MSHLIDLVLKQDQAMDLDDINNMDLQFNFDSPDMMMTSEFFDSVLSMEKESHADQHINNGKSSDIFSDDFLFKEETFSNGDSSASQCSPGTDHSSVDSEENFHERITLFGDVNSETIRAGDYYPYVDQACIQQNLEDFIDDSTLHTSKPIKRATPICPKKIIDSKPIIQANNRKVQYSGRNQVIRVQAGNKSLLLPVNVKKLKVIRANDIESIKMFNYKQPIMKKVSQYAASTSSESVDDDIDVVEHHDGSNYPALELTNEEKRLLMKEGIKLPTHYPLTKYEEKELKRIRRKIRNKISAQDSRKRKKEYVDQLEEKARKTDEENEMLKSKVKNLNKENTRLTEQLKKLQDLLCNGSSKATPTTCLMIVLFSTLLVCLPNLKTSDSKEVEMPEQQLISARRALLFNQASKEDEDQMNMDEFLVFNKEEAESIYGEEEKENGTSAFVKYLGDLSKKYETIIKSNCTEILQGGSLQEYCTRYEDEFKHALQDLRLYLDRNKEEEKKFIEPDISDDEDQVTFKHRSAYLLDDDDPPTKKSRISSENTKFDSTSVLQENIVELMGVESKLLPLKKE